MKLNSTSADQLKQLLRAVTHAQTGYERTHRHRKRVKLCQSLFKKACTADKEYGVCYAKQGS